MCTTERWKEADLDCIRIRIPNEISARAFKNKSLIARIRERWRMGCPKYYRVVHEFIVIRMYLIDSTRSQEQSWTYSIRVPIGTYEIGA